MIFSEKSVQKIMKQIIDYQPTMQCLMINQGKIITPNIVFYIKGKLISPEDQKLLIDNIGKDVFILCDNLTVENILLDIKITLIKFEEIENEKIIKVIIYKKIINENDERILEFLRNLE